jgi:hypothetical protein
MIYDIIILGGGIAGLFTTYELSKKYPTVKILLLEKSDRLGGRVFTYHDKLMTVDAGAGRFSKDHIHVVKLIKELGLSNKIAASSGSAVFVPADGTNSVQNSILYAPGVMRSKPIVPLLASPITAINGITDLVFTSGIDLALGEKNIPNAGLIIKVIAMSKLESREYLSSISFLEYASTILEKRDLEYIIGSFGYYSELVIMNAYDCIQLMQNLNPKNPFFILRGGLSQIIHGLEKKIKLNKNAKILMKRSVSGLSESSGVISIKCSNGVEYSCLKCICAVPKQVLEKISWFKPIYPLLRKIKCAPLCRIYCKFAKVGGSVWFKNLSKMTTNNNLRMIIPIDPESGVIMISYSDNKFADFWKDLNDKEGISGVDVELIRLVKQSTGLDIPFPESTHVFYWACGVGYWSVGADSSSISKQLIKPKIGSEVYVCGEHYSENFQQWMEGALETSSTILEKV